MARRRTQGQLTHPVVSTLPRSSRGCSRRPRRRVRRESRGGPGSQAWAVIDQLRILNESGLVEARRQAQRRIYSLRPQPFQELNAWLGTFALVWEDRMDKLDAYLRGAQDAPDERPAPPPPQSFCCNPSATAPT